MGEPTKLLCSLPGIEQNVASLLQTLTTFVSESRDRERCLLRRLDELSAQIVELKEEVRVSLEKKSAITAKGPPPSTPMKRRGQSTVHTSSSNSSSSNQTHQMKSSGTVGSMVPPAPASSCCSADGTAL
eukprot:scpid104942/ scgid15201/ 